MADDNDKSPLTRRRVLGGMATVGVAGAVGAGTWAEFNDEESATGNSVTAGTLDLKVNGGDIPQGASFTASDIAPGYSDSQSLDLENAGDVAGVLTANFHNLSENGGDNPEPEGDNSADLADNLKIEVSGDYGSYGPVTLSQVINGTPRKIDKNMMGGEKGTATIDLSVPSGVGNEIQGDEVTFDVTFTLEQK